MFGREEDSETKKSCWVKYRVHGVLLALQAQDPTPYHLLNIFISCSKTAKERGSSGAPGEHGNGRTGFFGSPVPLRPWTPEPTSPEDDQYSHPNPRMILRLLSTFIKRLIDWFILVTPETLDFARVFARCKWWFQTWDPAESKCKETASATRMSWKRPARR